MRQKHMAEKSWQPTVSYYGRFTHIMPCPCRAHVTLLPCRASKDLECVFPIWFTQCGRVWFTLAMPCSDHSVLLKATARPAPGGRAVALRRSAWSEHGMGKAWHGMASVNQTGPHCVNKMGKTNSKPLETRHGRGTAWARHGNGLLCVNRPVTVEDTENAARSTLRLCVQQICPEDSDYSFLQESAQTYWMSQCLIHEFKSAIFTAGVNINLNYFLRAWINITPSRSHVVLYVSEEETCMT